MVNGLIIYVHPKINIMKGIFRNLRIFLYYSGSVYGTWFVIWMIYFYYFTILIMWVLGLLNVYYTPEVGVGAALIAAGACTLPIYLKTRKPEDHANVVMNPKYNNWKYKLLTILFATGWIPLMFSLDWLTDIVELIF